MLYNYRRKKFILYTAFILTLMLSGCSTSIYLSKEDINNFDSYVTSLTAKESVDINELQEKMSVNIPKINDKDKASSIFNKYIYILYQETEKYLSYINIVGEDISNIKKDLDITTIDVSMYKDIYKKSKVIGAIFEEMYEKNLILLDENNSFNIDVNLEKLLSVYRNYLNEDIIEFLEFRISENNNSVFDINTDRYNTDILLERIATSVKNVTSKNSKSEQFENWKNSAVYYYNILFVDSMKKVLEEDEEVINTYIQELKSKLKTYKDDSIYNDIYKYIELLELNNNDIDNTDVQSYRDTLFEQILNTNNSDK